MSQATLLTQATSHHYAVVCHKHCEITATTYSAKEKQKFETGFTLRIQKPWTPGFDFDIFHCATTNQKLHETTN